MDIGQLVFLLSLGVLGVLRTPTLVGSPRRWVHLRIGVLGLCLGGLAYSFTARVAAAVSAALLVWSPLPFMKWQQRKRQKGDPSPQQQFFKAMRSGPKTCPPCK